MPVSGVVRNVHVGPVTIQGENSTVQSRAVQGATNGAAGFVAKSGSGNVHPFLHMDIIDVANGSVQIRIMNKGPTAAVFDHDLKVIVIAGDGTL